MNFFPEWKLIQAASTPHKIVLGRFGVEAHGKGKAQDCQGNKKLKQLDQQVGALLLVALWLLGRGGVLGL